MKLEITVTEDIIKDKFDIDDKYHSITTSDIKNVLEHNRNERLLDIYETPIRLEVKSQSESKVLSEYLSYFIKDSANIIIKDAYLYDPKNERNLKKYILPHIDLENCSITIMTMWDNQGKQRTVQRLMKYLGPNGNVVSINEKDKHNSYIKTDRYVIELGYRLLTFGIKDNGLTESETITITRI